MAMLQCYNVPYQPCPQQVSQSLSSPHSSHHSLRPPHSNLLSLSLSLSLLDWMTHWCSWGRTEGGHSQAVWLWLTGTRTELAGPLCPQGTCAVQPPLWPPSPPSNNQPVSGPLSLVSSLYNALYTHSLGLVFLPRHLRLEHDLITQHCPPHRRETTSMNALVIRLW